MNHKTSVVFTIAAVIIGVVAVLGAHYAVQLQAAVVDAEFTIQRPQADTQRVYGSSRAPIIIVEFSDFQCPFCARVHETLQRIVDEYDGAVAWEYRHLPLASHPLAEPAAVMAECVAQYKNNDAFWQFTNTLMADQASISNNSIEQLALHLGLAQEEIASCKDSEIISARIENDANTAAALGGSGTPFSVVLYPDNSFKTVSGAVPYEQWKKMIDAYDGE